jgi:catechol 2,3-dioxygenase-like lactoylglutathione lyase family enzyme
MPMRANEILETCIYAVDLEAAVDFYQRVLGLELYIYQESNHVFFRCGDGMLLIFDPSSSSKPGGELPPHGCSGAAHLAFGVPEADLDAWKKKLAAAAVPIELEFQWPQGGQSLYFRDPAGNLLELVTPRIWGIDETTLPG